MCVQGGLTTTMSAKKRGQGGRGGAGRKPDLDRIAELRDQHEKLLAKLAKKVDAMIAKLQPENASYASAISGVKALGQHVRMLERMDHRRKKAEDEEAARRLAEQPLPAAEPPPPPDPFSGVRLALGNE